MPSQTASSADIDPPIGVTYDVKTGKSVGLAMDLFSPGWRNPELNGQWHLRYLGDITKIWQDYTGNGVHVAVYDTGVESAHWDLQSNYDASLELVDDRGNRLSGEPVYYYPDDRTDSAHGTSCAGLIGAARNGAGGVGVAYGVRLTGVNIFDYNSQAADTMWSITKGGQFDVISNSWGYSGFPATAGFSRSNSLGFKPFIDSLAYLAETGRDGLGTVFVKAAGNDANENIGDGLNLDRHTVSVAAYRQVDGVASFYSCSGPYLLVSAPSNDYRELGGTGLVTTDLLGVRGYNQHVDPETPADYSDDFGGTSGATPIVSGVVSLMLSANADLGWRDVKNILAASAKMPIAFDTGPVQFILENNDQTRTLALNESQFKLGGGDANWNGGTMHYSNDYGYGAVDAYNAVRMAEVWSLFGAAKTSANEVQASVETTVNLRAVSDASGNEPTRLEKYNDFTGAPVSFSFEVSEAVDLEHVDLSLNFTDILQLLDQDGSPLADYYGALNASQIKLIAPDGTEAFNVNDRVVGGDAVDEFMLGFSGFHGVNSKGTWTLQLSTWTSLLPNEDGVLYRFVNDLLINSLKMDLYGSTPSNDDVYTYTNEFFTMAAIEGEGGRRTLTDTNGGTDWINAAAVTKNVTLSLVAGQATTFGSKTAFTIDRSSTVENAVTGDGNDTLIGNRYDNALYGMRGNDVLNGGMGNDTLFGGTGNDRFVFDTRSGKDTILDWSKGDIIATARALKGVGSDGLLTVGANATVLLDGTANGNTVLLEDVSGAKLQDLGKRDGYFWYAYVAEAAPTAGRVIEESAAQPGRVAAGSVQAITADVAGSHGADAFAHHAEGVPGHDGGQPFFLYDAMAGSMSNGVLLFA